MRRAVPARGARDDPAVSECQADAQKVRIQVVRMRLCACLCVDACCVCMWEVVLCVACVVVISRGVGLGGEVQDETGPRCKIR